MNNKVSIIIPIYNAQQYLERCIESIINQEYTNLEIILINDGSNDDSLKICNEYKIRDKRIVVIDKKNTGVSNTRNIGIEYATGEFLMFVDSDDYLLKDYVSSMVENMISNKVDIVKSGYSILEKNSIDYVSYKSNSCVLEYNDYKLDIINTPYLNSVWATLYSTELVKEFKFNEELKYVEDWEFTYRILKNKRISFLNNTGYQYIINDGSAMHSYEIKNVEKYFSDNLFVLNEIKLDAQDIVNIDEVINSRLLTKLNYTLIKLCYKKDIKYSEFKCLATRFLNNLNFDNIKNKNIYYENKVNIFRCILLKRKKIYVYFIFNKVIKLLKK